MYFTLFVGSIFFRGHFVGGILSVSCLRSGVPHLSHSLNE